jgi:hypothetical protein
MKDQQHNKDIEELLKQFKTQKNEGLDDFEREALEGFEMLDSKEEALEFKKETDTRAHEELFAKKKENKRVYWFAAAGLFLVIGLSVYFILNNPTINQKDVAYVQTDEQNVPEEKVMVAPPAEETPAATATSASNEKSSPKKVAEDKQPAKPIAVSEKAEEKEEGQLKSRAILKPAGVTNNTTTVPEDAIAMDKRDDAGDKDLEKGKVLSKDANLTLADTKSKQQEEDQQKREVTKNEGYTDDLSKSGKVVLKEAEEKKASGKKYRYKRKESAASIADEESTTKTTEKAPVTNGIAGNGNYVTPAAENRNNNNEGPVNAMPKTSVNMQTTVPAYTESDKKADEYNSPTNSLSYAGGESALKTELSAKLSEKNIDKKFDVLLIINDKKKVEKVNYLNVYDLTTEERDKVTEVLKGLSKFNFGNTPKSNGLYEYKIEYRP